MAELDVQPKKATPWWLWLILLLIVLAIFYFLFNKSDSSTKSGVSDSTSTTWIDTRDKQAVASNNFA